MFWLDLRMDLYLHLCCSKCQKLLWYLDNHFIDLASSFASFNSDNSSAIISYLRLYTASKLHKSQKSILDGPDLTKKRVQNISFHKETWLAFPPTYSCQWSFVCMLDTPSPEDSWNIGCHHDDPDPDHHPHLTQMSHTGWPEPHCQIRIGGRISSW